MDIITLIGLYLLFLIFELFSIYCHDALPNRGHGSSFTFSPRIYDIDEGFYLSISLAIEHYYSEVIIPYELYKFKIKEIEKLNSDIFPFYLFFPVLYAVGAAVMRVDGINVLVRLLLFVPVPLLSFIMHKLYSRSSWSLPAFKCNEFNQLEEQLRKTPYKLEFEDGIRPSARINNRMNELHARYIDSVYYRVMRRCYMRPRLETIYFLVFIFISVALSA